MKLKNPLTFSPAFGVDRTLLRKLGIVNHTLNVGTKLFIDPLLLGTTAHPVMQRARKRFDDHFRTAIKLLDASRAKGDVAWRNARRMLDFPEVRGTCLGYSAASTGGAGFGTALTDQLIDTSRISRVERVGAPQELGISTPTPSSRVWIGARR